MSSTFRDNTRWVLGNAGLALLVALVTTPLSSSISLAESWPLEGWNGSAIEIYVGWTLLLLPFVIFVAIPALAAVLVVIRLRRPSRPLVIVLAVVVGDGLSTALLTRPFDRDPGVVEVVLAALLFLPIWATYGAVVRLPSAGPQVSLTHAH